MKKIFLFIFLVYIKMSEIAVFTYYQKNKDMILNKAKDYYKNNEEIMRRDWRSKQEINTETYLKKKKIKKENMGRIDTIKKITMRQKSLNITMNKIIF